MPPRRRSRRSGSAPMRPSGRADGRTSRTALKRPSVLSLTWWASAASATSRGACERSPAQSRNDDLNPCGTAAMPNSLIILDIVESDIARPVALGKIRSDPSAKSRASSRTASAASDSGTRCSRPAFMRSAGTVHVADARSTSSHRACRASPDREAVSIKNSNASLVDVSASAPPARPQARPPLRHGATPDGASASAVRGEAPY